jgi:hypothetical protein
MAVVGVPDTLHQKNVVGEQQQNRSPKEYCDGECNVRFTGEANSGEFAQDVQVWQSAEQKHSSHVAVDQRTVNDALTLETTHSVQGAIVKEDVVYFRQQSCGKEKQKELHNVTEPNESIGNDTTVNCLPMIMEPT